MIVYAPVPVRAIVLSAPGRVALVRRLRRVVGRRRRVWPTPTPTGSGDPRRGTCCRRRSSACRGSCRPAARCGSSRRGCSRAGARARTCTGYVSVGKSGLVRVAHAGRTRRCSASHRSCAAPTAARRRGCARSRARPCARPSSRRRRARSAGRCCCRWSDESPSSSSTSPWPQITFASTNTRYLRSSRFQPRDSRAAIVASKSSSSAGSIVTLVDLHAAVGRVGDEADVALAVGRRRAVADDPVGVRGPLAERVRVRREAVRDVGGVRVQHLARARRRCRSPSHWTRGDAPAGKLTGAGSAATSTPGGRRVGPVRAAAGAHEAVGVLARPGGRRARGRRRSARGGDVARHDVDLRGRRCDHEGADEDRTRERDREPASHAINLLRIALGVEGSPPHSSCAGPADQRVTGAIARAGEEVVAVLAPQPVAAGPAEQEVVAVAARTVVVAGAADSSSSPALPRSRSLPARPIEPVVDPASRRGRWQAALPVRRSKRCRPLTSSTSSRGVVALAVAPSAELPSRSTVTGVVRSRVVDVVGAGPPWKMSAPSGVASAMNRSSSPTPLSVSVPAPPVSVSSPARPLMTSPLPSPPIAFGPGPAGERVSAGSRRRGPRRLSWRCRPRPVRRRWRARRG